MSKNSRNSRNSRNSINYLVALLALLAVAVVSNSVLTRTAAAAPARIIPAASSAPAANQNLPGPRLPGRLALLPGDGAIGPAAGNQQYSQIAAGGNGYLVVWEDSRANFGWGAGNAAVPTGSSGGQSLSDIYAARLDANGQLLDATPIVVSQATWDQTRPRVSWNGQNWLVVWTTQRVAGLTSTYDVAAARISPSGVLLDSTPIIVDGTDSVDEQFPVVSSDGTNWVVVWFDQGSYFELDAARISNEGVLLDPGGVAIYTPQQPYAPYNASIAFAGDEYLVAWMQWGTNDDNIVGMRLTPSLQTLGGVFTISAQPGNEISPSVASNGADFFVVWQDNRAITSVVEARISHGGAVLDPGGINITNGNYIGYPNPAASWDGTQWFAAWEANNNSIYAARVSPGGTVTDPGGFVVASGPVGQVAIASPSNGGARIAWTDNRSGGSFPEDIYTAGVSGSGAVGPGTPASQGAPSQRQPELATNGSGYLSVFMSAVGGETRVKAQRLDASGTAIDAEPILVAGGSSTLGNPAVAWNGTVYLIVWEDISSGQGFAPGTIYGRRMQANGTFLDPSPVAIMPGNTPDVGKHGTW